MRRIEERLVRVLNPTSSPKTHDSLISPLPSERVSVNPMLGMCGLTLRNSEPGARKWARAGRGARNAGRWRGGHLLSGRPQEAGAALES